MIQSFRERYLRHIKLLQSTEGQDMNWDTQCGPWREASILALGEMLEELLERLDSNA